MKSFKDLDIKPEVKGLTGRKIEIERLLNVPIIVLSYTIEPSKFPKHNNDKCLYLQIEQEGVKNVVFTSSSVLMNMIERVPKDAFPFTTTIIKQDKRLEFT